MRTFLLFIALQVFVASPTLRAQELKPYAIFSADGKRSDYGKMLKQLAKADIVLFGELHNSSIAHWLQLEVAKDLAKSRNLVLGAEMLEADNQTEVDRYLKGDIDAKGLDTLARLWNNHATDYAPLVNFAKDKALPFVATNVPRRYATMVYKKGFAALDTLPDGEKAWMAPLPIAYDPELPGYKGMLAMMGGHGGENLPKAQALKDATMAHFILKNRAEGQLSLHFNGAYHSDRYEGIVWYLRKARPELRIVTLSTVQQKDIDKLEEEHAGKADFILCVDEDVPGSY
jgi:uncharacterized iron-regulated protein